MATTSGIPFACRLAQVGDLGSWLELVREVEYLFGPMADFIRPATRGIERGTALVAVEGDVVIGAALLSRDDKPHHINWLAVRQSARRRGGGSLLMAAILQRWPTGDIEVVTFGTTVPAGEPARRYYERFGFQCHGPAEPSSDGESRDLLILPRPHVGG